MGIGQTRQLQGAPGGDVPAHQPAGQHPQPNDLSLNPLDVLRQHGEHRLLRLAVGEKPVGEAMAGLERFCLAVWHLGYDLSRRARLRQLRQLAQPEARRLWVFPAVKKSF